MDAAVLLLHHDRFASGEDTFLVAIGFSLAEVLDHREPHRLRRSESEQAGVADVQRDDLVTSFFQFVRMIGQLTANLVLHVAQRVARSNSSGWPLALFQCCNAQIVPAFFSREIVSAE